MVPDFVCYIVIGIDNVQEEVQPQIPAKWGCPVLKQEPEKEMRCTWILVPAKAPNISCNLFPKADNQSLYLNVNTF